MAAMRDAGRLTVWWDEHSDRTNVGWVCELAEWRDGEWEAVEQAVLVQPSRLNLRAACQEAAAAMCVDVAEPIRTERPDVEEYELVVL
jgi:hypothetical protein